MVARNDSRISAVLQRVQSITDQTAKNLERELGHIEEEKRRVTADLDGAADRIRQTLVQLGRRVNGVSRSPSRRQVRSTKRIRRSLEELRREADAIFQLIKRAGNEGVKGGDIRKVHPKVGPDIKGFVQKYGGHKVRTTGKKATTRYLG